MTSKYAEAAEALARGEVVGIPTDTVYGLATVATSQSGLEEIFRLKGRPRDFALPVLVADLDQAERFLGGTDRRLERLAERYWPGALTVVVTWTPATDSGLGGDGKSVGLRCPGDEALRGLCREVGPLAVTSANRHGEPPITSASQFASAFAKEVDLVVDGGDRDGVPSTVISIVGEAPVCLREGPISFSSVRAVIEQRVES